MSSKKKIFDQIKLSGDIPNHIAIIMDGNGRWAKKRGLPRAAGHKKGVDTVKEITENCAEIGVKYLTLYTFSTENWNRPKDEVSTLMRLLLKSLKERVSELNENNIRLSTIGNISALPNAVQNELKEAIEKTKNNDKMTLNLALSYSGRWELIEAIKSIGKLVSQRKLKVEDINENSIKNFLTTKNIPDPDLLIRTSGEFRVSNFLLWQIAYTEFFITNVFWPDFNKNHLVDAIKSYQTRERRFGRVSNQINEKKKVEGFNNAHIQT
ncbi:MAG: di-trans,poly-cis-decaprenylcistransferase [Ignavibacteriales bacterium CG12_big_fil_rev_8_21_14_0_65_30_8]|nr:MAG: di-trans,poly-cis-decaprenylcistransferase [Ignavibacteriales bacterium CG12_big_fil_rev_8_21_14_0_65_30_8]